MASTKKYQVIFTGELQNGADSTEVKRRLAETFKTSVDRIEKLFSSAPTVINNNLDEATAQEYAQTIQAIGVRCTVEPMPETFSIQPRTQPQHQVQKHSQQTQHSSDSAFWKGTLIATSLTLLLALYFYLLLFIASNLIIHLDENTDWFDTLPHGFGIVAYIIVALVYICLLFALTKVFFISPQKKQPSTTLARKKEPSLYSYIEKLSSSLGVKPPILIEVNLGTSISIEYKRGILSFLEEQQSLTIGLPLVYQFSLSEFTCAVTTTLAHYINPRITRIYFFIKSIINIFQKGAKDYDTLDTKLILFRNTAGNIITRSFFSFLLFFVSIAKKVNTLFLRIAHVISKNYLYALEYEADRIAGSVTGYDVFESMLMKQYLLQALHSEGIELLRKERKPNDRSLPNDFSELISLLLQQKTDEDLKKLKASIATQKEKNYLTPSFAERISQVKKRPTKGSLDGEKPASTLFTQLQELSRTLTLRFFREQLNIQFSPQDLISSSDYINPPESEDMILDQPIDRGFF